MVNRTYPTRLRSIPAQTLGTRTPRRAGTIAPGWVIQVRQQLLQLGGQIRELGSADHPDASQWEPPAGFRAGRVPAPPRERPASAGGGGAHGRAPQHGRVYQRAATPRRAVDLVIPPRTDGSPVTHAIEEEPAALIVRITFPVPVPPDEIRWEIHGDVLEVESLGTAVSYYHAFLVPPDIEPVVELDGRTMTFRFRAGA